jgi:hypothetical protein
MLFSFLSSFFHAVSAATLAIVMPISAFFSGQTQHSGAEITIVTPPAASSSPIVETPTATTSVLAVALTTTATTTTAKKVAPKAKSAPKSAPVVTPVIVPAPSQPPTSTPTAPATTASATPSASTSAERHTIGSTIIAIQSIPLLFGGEVKSGKTVPIAYLQMTNVGTEGMQLKGFWVKQNGSAPTQAIIGLSTVDDKGGSRGLVGGVEGGTPFQNGIAFAPTDAYFAPGQMRLFTIKAIMSQSLTPYIGTNLMIDVTSIESTAATQGSLPIRGTTWTIAQ